MWAYRSESASVTSCLVRVLSVVFGGVLLMTCVDTAEAQYRKNNTYVFSRGSNYVPRSLPRPVMQRNPVMTRAFPQARLQGRGYVFTDRSRAAALAYQRELSAQRNAYYARERRMDAVARGLKFTSRASDVAGVAGAAYVFRGRPGMTTGQWLRNDRARNFARDVIKDRIISGTVERGANKVFSNPSVSTGNARFWGY